MFEVIQGRSTEFSLCISPSVSGQHEERSFRNRIFVGNKIYNNMTFQTIHTFYLTPSQRTYLSALMTVSSRRISSAKAFASAKLTCTGQSVKMFVVNSPAGVF